MGSSTTSSRLTNEEHQLSASINYKFPDPTDPDQFNALQQPTADSLIESAISMTTNTEPEPQSDETTEWSILSLNPKQVIPTTDQQQENQIGHEPTTTTQAGSSKHPTQAASPEKATEPSSPEEATGPSSPEEATGPSSTEEATGPSSAKEATQAALPDQPPIPKADEPHKCQQWVENLPAHQSGALLAENSMMESIIQTVLTNSDQEKSDHPNEILHSSQTTSELGPNDSASQCVYHRPERRNLGGLSEHPTVEPSIEGIEGPTENLLDPAMDLSSAYLDPEQLSMLSVNLPPNPPPSINSTAPSLVIPPPRAPSSKPASSSTSSRQSSAVRSTPSSQITEPKRYPTKTISLLLLSIFAILSFTYWQYYLQNFYNVAIFHGPTHTLFQDANFEPTSAIEKDSSIDPLSIETVPIITNDQTFDTDQILQVDASQAHKSSLSSSPPQPQIAHAAISYPEQPLMISSPPLENHSENLVDPPVLTRPDEIIDPMSIPAPASNQPPVLVHDTPENQSPNSYEVPDSNLDRWILGLAIISITSLLIRRVKCFRGESTEEWSVDQLIAGLETQDCAISIKQLQHSLAKLSKDGAELARFTKVLKTRVRAQKSPQIEMGLLAWAQAVNGELEGSQTMWIKFWELAALQHKKSSQSGWLDLLEILGQDYRGLSRKQEDNDCGSTLDSSSTLTEKPTHDFTLKSDPQLDDPSVTNQSVVDSKAFVKLEHPSVSSILLKNDHGEQKVSPDQINNGTRTRSTSKRKSSLGPNTRPKKQLVIKEEEQEPVMLDSELLSKKAPKARQSKKKVQEDGYDDLSSDLTVLSPVAASSAAPAPDAGATAPVVHPKSTPKPKKTNSTRAARKSEPISKQAVPSSSTSRASLAPASHPVRSSPRLSNKKS
ncbi:tropomyosin [Puccinia graminis f. sp. tritici]|uniref:Tropomyosin n=1 Tax=Puccinia graminis f. sp. tritici TaxID=56615 RepID=A0A5B0N2M1_PUCGR|nr:tropomyosin [Puccinia graminis f. sp. tritici]KAA1087936.1 tropomyosin [Puccinia graminis f. sp. tritici]